MRRYGYDWIVWALMLGLPAVAFWQIATSLTEQEVASGGPMQNAAIFPEIVAWVLLGLCGLQALRIATGHVGQPSPVEGTPTTRTALTASALFIVFLLSLGWLGYYIAAPLLLAALLRLFGVGWLNTLHFAVGLTVAVAFIFEGLLNVVLPLGFSKFTFFG
ncbi:tripartite tricarboxylate transporter TctB family protein [Sulfitobacter sp. D35]|uniref:tripartite tricarboxylate transporter TctB family protein n=1 Tax=Sulfitobacter sp. D35 TaxID=3083252 RepID=UPI00296F3A8B|nr:tripartite tricarboxylate transporter TctB family protein [Sulfitobacter sp. D35]MDW4499346.1 tripartite tricarboxylate transporter TctB family protein [Sulfitobacter sp. D35]